MVAAVRIEMVAASHHLDSFLIGGVLVEVAHTQVICDTVHKVVNGVRNNEETSNKRRQVTSVACRSIACDEC